MQVWHRSAAELITMKTTMMVQSPVSVGFIANTVTIWFHHSASCVRGASLAKGPDSSLDEVHKGSCSEDIHMEEEKVEVKVQEDEAEDGRDK